MQKEEEEEGEEEELKEERDGHQNTGPNSPSAEKDFNCQPDKGDQ